ncbi:uncharacterized protein LOC114015437 [Falco cherrug]|uniref:uncharacterized protein LOC114015437 n=1 Tax=Falco cherrug TaxID=345164 RepID=UPI002478924A|nr:uncharacterized protein LOC114015437 [Falco cherrug]
MWTCGFIQRSVPPRYTSSLADEESCTQGNLTVPNSNDPSHSLLMQHVGKRFTDAVTPLFSPGWERRAWRALKARDSSCNISKGPFPNLTWGFMAANHPSALSSSESRLAKQGLSNICIFKRCPAVPAVSYSKSFCRGSLLRPKAGGLQMDLGPLPAMHSTVSWSQPCPCMQLPAMQEMLSPASKHPDFGRQWSGS